MFRITLQHDQGLTTITLYGHNSEESAISTIMKMERCPQRAIIKVEDLRPTPRTLGEITRII